MAAVPRGVRAGHRNAMGARSDAATRDSRPDRHGAGEGIAVLRDPGGPGAPRLADREQLRDRHVLRAHPGDLPQLDADAAIPGARHAGRADGPLGLSERRGGLRGAGDLRPVSDQGNDCHQVCRRAVCPAGDRRRPDPRLRRAVPGSNPDRPPELPRRVPVRDPQLGRGVVAHRHRADHTAVSGIVHPTVLLRATVLLDWGRELLLGDHARLRATSPVRRRADRTGRRVRGSVDRHALGQGAHGNGAGAARDRRQQQSVGQRPEQPLRRAADPPCHHARAVSSPSDSVHTS